jgi:quinoprotein glucose dehydrogenase
MIVGAAAAGIAWQTPPRPRVPPPTADEWPSHLHDPGGTRYSPLMQITPANVGQLKVAWVYHMKPPAPPRAEGAGDAPLAPAPGRGRGRGFGSANGFAQSEVTPIVAGGMLFITTPYGRVVALDPTTGQEVWVFAQPNVAQASTRGLEYWRGDAAHTPRLVFHGGGGLVELDPKTGEPITGFGRNGVLAPLEGGGANGSSPPVLYGNIIISQSANPNRDGRNGDIRAFDVLTGKPLWRFATIPAKGEPGYESWAPGSAERQTSVHVWGLMTIDTQRGILYGATNAPEWNRYGGDRAGDNLYSSTLLALDAATGKLRWHFQLVHHDIWDLDGSPPPILIDVKRGGRTISAIAAMSKAGLLFLLDRVTGTPIYGVEERLVAGSDVPEERTSPTQPFPIKPAPLGRQTFSMEDVATVTPELHEYCANLIEKYHVTMGGPYKPPGFNHPSINFPGPNASTNWGGGAFDPQLGYLVVNSQDLGQLTQLGPRDQPRELTIGIAGAGSGGNPAIPYDMVGVNGRFKDPDLNMMCQQPPWGSLTAVDVNTGTFAWRVPLGVTDTLPPDRQKTGRPSSGGPIVTASGLVFIGATDDLRFRAFDTKTGQELWVEKLPASSHSVPVTYMGRDGKQYVVFPATGGSLLQDPALGDSLFAYALK